MIILEWQLLKPKCKIQLVWKVLLLQIKNVCCVRADMAVPRD